MFKPLATVDEYELELDVNNLDNHINDKFRNHVNTVMQKVKIMMFVNQADEDSSNDADDDEGTQILFPDTEI